jgi:hypothetical protein
MAERGEIRGCSEAQPRSNPFNQVWMGTRKAFAPLVLFALLAGGLSACGGSGTDTTTAPPPPPVSASIADHLAKLSNRIATYLDAGDTCSAAYAADQLQAAVQDADLSSALRPGVEEVATRLVNEVNCPPPPPPPEPEKEKKKEKPDEQKDEKQQGDEDKPPGHGGIPPGKAKLKGE